MSEIRLDNFDIPKMKKTPEGYLKGDAFVTRTGVFKYMNQDGSYRYELRHPSEVFKKESLDTIKNIPITIEHPKVLVDATNSHEYMVGMTGGDINNIDDMVISNLTITHDNAIKKIRQGKLELSMAYTQNLTVESGIYEGQKYTHKQTDIKYNHLAVVDKGRAGNQIRIITMDGADHYCTYINNDKKEEFNMEEKDLEKIMARFDSIESVIKDNSELKDKNDNLSKEVNGLKEQLDVVQAQLTENKVNTDSVDDASIQERVNQRVSIILKSKSVLPQGVINLDSMSDREIMENTLKASGNTEDMVAKSDEYVAGRFDSLNTFDDKAILTQMSNVGFRKDSATPILSMTEILKTNYNKYRTGN